MQVCAPVTFPINIVEHLTSCCCFFTAKDPLYHNRVVLPQFAVRTVFNPIFFSISTAIRSCISCCSPGLFLLSLILLFSSCLSYNAIQSALESIGTLCNMEVSLLWVPFCLKCFGSHKSNFPLFSAFKLIERARQSLSQGPTQSTWMLLAEGFGWISISKYSWCLLAIANLSLAGVRVVLWSALECSSCQGGGGKKGAAATWGRKKDFKCRICPCYPCGCSWGDVEACGERKKQEWQSSPRRALLSCSHATLWWPGVGGGSWSFLPQASSDLLSCGLDFFMQPANAVCSASLGWNSQWYLF